MHDTLENYKDIHLKLKKDTHTGLRILLFKKRLSLQETVEELARLLVAEDPKLIRILDKLILRKTKEKIQKLRDSDKSNLSQLDQETIYNLLEEQSPIANRESSQEDDDELD